MSEHGWPDFPGDHHDDPGLPSEHHDPHVPDGGHEDGPWYLPAEPEPDHAPWGADSDDPFGSEGHSAGGDEPGGHDPAAADPGGHEAADPVPGTDPVGAAGVVGADPDAYADPLPDAAFPPPLELGPLPEPVDGFPWIDAAGLGDAGSAEPHLEAVDPHELAGYAGVDLPAGADPWAVLAGSADPATSALARWWAQQAPD